MATTLPSDASNANLDQGTDDVGQARTDLNGVVTKFNDLKGALGAAAQLNLAADGGLTAAGQAAGTPDDLKIKLQSTPALVLAAAGLRVDVNSLTELVAANVADNDELLIWDVTAAAFRKVRKDSLGGGAGGWEVYSPDFSQVFADGNTEFDLSAGFNGSDEYLINVDNVQPSSDDQVYAQVKTSSGWETTRADYRYRSLIWNGTGSVTPVHGLDRTQAPSTDIIEFAGSGTIENGADQGWSGKIKISHATADGWPARIEIDGDWRTGGSSTYNQIRAVYHFDPNREITGFRFQSDGAVRNLGGDAQLWRRSNS